MKMKLNVTKIGICTLLLLVAQNASAYPVFAQSLDNPRCDPLPQMNLSHELGDAPVFPIDELIASVSAQVPMTVCVGDDGIANDWLVTITNLSPTAWMDMMFVVDQLNAVGNADGVVIDATGAGTDAFLIDPFGVNPNLIFESMTPNVIFEPGETWEFLVTNFIASGLPTPFDSLDIGALSVGLPSTASIIANPAPTVPIPSSIWLFGSGILGLIGITRHKKA